MKNPKIHISESHELLLQALAEWFISKASKTIIQKGHFSVVLSGGNSPKEFYQLLASEDYREKLDWTKIYFFFGDERYVPQNNEKSNFLMAKKALFEPLNIPANNFFAVNTTLSPKKAAEDYCKSIHDFFEGEKVNFDLILLGLGDNSHTASLFPFTEVLKEEKATVKSVFVPEIDAFRITFSAPLINQGKNIVLLVYGKSKAEAVKHILQDPFLPEEFPAQLINPSSGELHWFLDKEAASLLI